MKLDQQIIDRLKELVKVPSIAFPAIVNSVDKDLFTCTVTPQGGVKMVDVRLKAGIEEQDDGLVEIPALGSSVLVVLMANQEENAFVAKCSQVEEVLFYGGTHGGLIKVQELVSQLEKVNQFLLTIKNGFTNAPVAPNDGGPAFKNFMKSALESAETGDYSNIENPKVKH